MSGEEAGTVEVRPGRHIAWRAFGDGPPLLLINGYAATGADWDPAFLGALAADHRVICPDNVGLGASALADDDTVGGVEGMAADMVALLDALAIERVALVGWSMGGFVAQSLVRAVPGRVTSVGLISTHTGGPDCVNGSPEVARELVDHSGTPREQARRLISLLFPPDRVAEADERFGEIVAAARAGSPSGCSSCRRKRFASGTGARTRSRSPMRASRSPSSTAPSTPWCCRERRGPRPVPSRRPGDDRSRLRPRADGARAGRRRGGDPGDDQRRRVGPSADYGLPGATVQPMIRTTIPIAPSAKPAYCKRLAIRGGSTATTSSPRRSRT